MNEEGVVADRRSMTVIQNKMYKKHHRVHGILVEALPHVEYMKIGIRSTGKSIFKSLCSTYEENLQVKEAKTNQLVHQYELLRMKENEDIETMFSRFQTFVYGLQVLKNSYGPRDHVKNILRSLNVKFKPKVISIQVEKDLDTLILKNLISSHRQRGVRGVE